jgi:predicted dehydrogenase
MPATKGAPANGCGRASRTAGRGAEDFSDPAEIIEAVREGRSVIDHAATFEDGLAVQAVLDAARESDKTGRTVQVETKDETAAA